MPQPPPTTYVAFILQPKDASRKTNTWSIQSKSGGSKLGVIAWHSPWRRYTYWVPAAEYSVIMDATCLKEITAFIDYQMQLRKMRALNPPPKQH